jgi:Triose-phosphate Transporter family
MYSQVCTAGLFDAGAAVNCTHDFALCDVLFSRVHSSLPALSRTALTPLQLVIVPFSKNFNLSLFLLSKNIGIAQLDFSMTALLGAMGSNVAASSRAILAKASMSKPKGTNMGAANLYGVLTVLATAMLVPIAAIFEGPHIQVREHILL